MSKHIGRSKKKQSGRMKKREDRAMTVASSISRSTHAFASEWSQKHNDLVNQVSALAALSAQKHEQIWSVLNVLIKSNEHVDLNVLALSELNKMLYKTLYPDDLQWEEKYKVDMAEAFRVVQERMRKEDEEKKAAAEKLKQEAEKAKVDSDEVKRVTDALQQAESEPLGSVPGGPGAEFPEGAQIFGGE